MIVSITFPDGKRRTYRITVRRGDRIEDIAEKVADEMLREYAKHHSVKNPSKYVDGVLRWLIPALYSNLLEKYGGTIVAKEEGESTSRS